MLAATVSLNSCTSWLTRAILRRRQLSVSDCVVVVNQDTSGAWAVENAVADWLGCFSAAGRPDQGNRFTSVHGESRRFVSAARSAPA